MATITPQPRPRSIPGSRISRRKQAYHSPVTKLMPWATTNRRGEAPSRARVLQGASVSTQPIRAPTGNPPRPIGDRPARSRRAREPAHEAFHGSITARSPSTNPPCETSFRNRWAPTGSAVGLAHVRYATPRWRFAPAACLGQHWGGRASSPSRPREVEDCLRRIWRHPRPRRTQGGPKPYSQGSSPTRSTVFWSSLPAWSRARTTK